MPQFLRDGEIELYQVFGRHTWSLVDAPFDRVRYQENVASFRNWSISKSKIRPNFDIFDLRVKIRRGGWNIWLLSHKVELLDLRYFHPFWIHNPSIATGSKIEAKFGTFLAPIPVKFRKGMDEASEWIFGVRPTIKLIVYFWLGVSLSSERLDHARQKSAKTKQNGLQLYIGQP